MHATPNLYRAGCHHRGGVAGERDALLFEGQSDAFEKPASLPFRVAYQVFVLQFQHAVAKFIAPVPYQPVIGEVILGEVIEGIGAANNHRA